MCPDESRDWSKESYEFFRIDPSEAFDALLGSFASYTSTDDVMVVWLTPTPTLRESHGTISFKVKGASRVELATSLTIRSAYSYIPSVSKADCLMFS